MGKPKTILLVNNILEMYEVIQLIVFIFVSISFVSCNDYVTKSSTKAPNATTVRFKACVEGCKRSHPRVPQRFSDYKLDMWCEDMDHWYQQLLKPHHRFPYTSKQIAFINSVQRCRTNHECFGQKARGKRQTPLPPAIRKECRALTKIEFQRFTNALNTLKKDKIDGTSKYDLLVSYHFPKASPQAHYGPAFMPFHREYLKQLETALRHVDPNTALCYWDSNLDQGLPKPQDSCLWTEDLFGNGNDAVTIGPFGNWIATMPYPGSDDNYIHRGVGESDVWDLYTEEDINFFMTKSRYQNLASYCTEPTFTVLHNSVHEFVGGHMIYTAISPNDPVFFLHHTFVDYIWETWRLAKQTPQQRETDYPEPGPSACGSLHYANSPLKPFPMLNIQGLSNNYSTLFRYAPAPTCNSDCVEPYLFCDTNRNRCIPKVRPNGNCTGLEQFNSCLNSTCIKGNCSLVMAVSTVTPQPQQTETPQPQQTETPQPQKTETPQPQKTETPQPLQPETPQPQVKTKAAQDRVQWWEEKVTTPQPQQSIETNVEEPDSQNFPDQEDQTDTTATDSDKQFNVVESEPFNGDEGQFDTE